MQQQQILSPWNTFNHASPLWGRMLCSCACPREDCPNRAVPPIPTNHPHWGRFRCISDGKRVILQHQFTVLSSPLPGMCVKTLSLMSHHTVQTSPCGSHLMAVRKTGRIKGHKHTHKHMLTLKHMQARGSALLGGGGRLKFSFFFVLFFFLFLSGGSCGPRRMVFLFCFVFWCFLTFVLIVCSHSILSQDLPFCLFHKR